MPTDWTAFGGGATETVMGTGVFVLMLVTLLLTFTLPRRLALAPLMFGIFLLPVGQTFVVFGVHLYVVRILILGGLVRAVIARRSRGLLLSFGYTSIDKIFTVWTAFHALAFILVHQEMGAIVNQLGFFWDALGGYFLMRMLIANDDDVRRVITIFSSIAAILAATMLYEKLVGVNVYGVLTAHAIIPEVRQGSIRAQGPFHHAILAGTFGATLLPLFYWLWRNKSYRILGFVGMFASTAITLCAASSTPVSAYLAAVLGICLWPIRKSMRLVRRSIVIGILMLNFTMHAPVWWILAHVDLAGGSAGHHRAELVDNFVNHFSDWWLIGTKDYESWGFLMKDISNQYVAEGEVGGLVSFISIIAVITLSFKRIGICRKLVQGDRKKEWDFWLLGAALFSHTFAFFGIGYFDQTKHAWYALLAIISTATATAIQRFEKSRFSGLFPVPDVRLGEAALPSAAGDSLGREIL
jgi:hypothetical protein